MESNESGKLKKPNTFNALRNLEAKEVQLIYAINAQDTNKALNLIQTGIDLDFVNPDSEWTLLNYAIEHGNIQVAKCLMDRGFNINHAGEGKNGWPPIHHAVEFACDSFVQDDKREEPETEILEYLMTHNPDLTRKDGSGKIAMDYAHHDKLRSILNLGM